MSIFVFGSINMDLVARTPRLPAPGETITGHEFFTAPGGKGANQAVAAARLNAPVKMVGRVGADGFGAELRQSLVSAGVDVAGVQIDPAASSGVAMIAVNDKAQNNIIVIPGANGRVDQTDVERLDQQMTGSGFLLLQLEVPLPAVIAAAKLARQRGLTVILDPSPACTLPPELYAATQIITPNALEASQLVGFDVLTPTDAEHASYRLLSRGVRTVIIKMGWLGVFYASLGGIENFIPAFKVKAIDTVAAGDAFNGALAVALWEGRSLEEAVRWGVAVGALAVTKAGAQPSLPHRAEVDHFLESQDSELAEN